MTGGRGEWARHERLNAPEDLADWCEQGPLRLRDMRADADDLRPWVAANAMIGAHRALIELSRRRVVAGDLGPDLPRDVRAEADRALDLLEAGLGGFAPKDPAAPTHPSG